MDKIKKICIIVAAILILFIPILIVCIILLVNKDADIFTDLNFWYSYMTYFGTVVIALVAVWQNNKAQKSSEMTQNLSLKFDTLNVMQNYCFAQISKKLFYKYNKKNDRKITWSGMGKYDFGSMLFVEKEVENNVPLDETYFEFTFNDCSNSMIKKVEIDDNITCLQDYNNDGNEYPVCFISYHNRNDSEPIWISKNLFKIRIKMYCQQNKVYTNFLSNSRPLIIIFRTKYISVTNVKSHIVKVNCLI